MRPGKNLFDRIKGNEVCDRLLLELQPLDSYTHEVVTLAFTECTCRESGLLFAYVHHITKSAEAPAREYFRS